MNKDYTSTGLNFDLEHLIKLEKSILGACLVDNSEAVREIMFKHNLLTHDFYRIEHKELYTAMQKCWENNIPIDIITVSEYRPLKYKENKIYLDAQAWDKYNIGLTEFICSSANLEFHIILFKQYVLARFWNRIANDITFMNWNKRDVLEVGDTILNKYNTIWERITKDIKGKDKQDSYEVEVTRKYLANASGVSTLLSTGVPEINQLLKGGLSKGELIILAGRPGMMKTTIALIIGWMSCKLGNPIAFFSLEMPAHQLKNKIVAMETGIDYLDLKNGRISSSQLGLVSQVNKKIIELGFHIIEDCKTIEQISARSAKLAEKSGIKLAILDYIQRCKFKGDMREGITAISRECKSIAKDNDIPFIALSQLSRAVEKRINKRPILSDLKESGSIEEDADVVLFPFREAYYAAMEGRNIANNDLWKTEMNIGKGRDIGTDTKLIVNVNPILMTIEDYQPFKK